MDCKQGKHGDYVFTWTPVRLTRNCKDMAFLVLNLRLLSTIFSYSNDKKLPQEAMSISNFYTMVWLDFNDHNVGLGERATVV